MGGGGMMNQSQASGAPVTPMAAGAAKLYGGQPAPGPVGAAPSPFTRSAAAPVAGTAMPATGGSPGMTGFTQPHGEPAAPSTAEQAAASGNPHAAAMQMMFRGNMAQPKTGRAY